jgi:hypothetical protein
MTTPIAVHEADKLNPDELGQMQVRLVFRQWLRRHRRRAKKTPIPKLMTEFHGRISQSSAYRAAMKEGLRGRRYNSTRYTEFWGIINWALPDHSLEQIWGVSRQNVRHRRVRIGAGEPKFSARGKTWPDEFVRAFEREIEKAQNYHGPRPR